MGRQFCRVFYSSYDVLKDCFPNRAMARRFNGIRTSSRNQMDVLRLRLKSNLMYARIIALWVEGVSFFESCMARVIQHLDRSIAACGVLMFYGGRRQGSC